MMFQKPNDDTTICFVPLKDGTVAEMTQRQFDAIEAGEVIAGISRDDFKRRPINRYQQIREDQK